MRLLIFIFVTFIILFAIKISYKKPKGGVWYNPATWNPATWCGREKCPDQEEVLPDRRYVHPRTQEVRRMVHSTGIPLEVGQYIDSYLEDPLPRIPIRPRQPREPSSVHPRDQDFRRAMYSMGIPLHSSRDIYSFLAPPPASTFRCGHYSDCIGYPDYVKQIINNDHTPITDADGPQCINNVCTSRASVPIIRGLTQEEIHRRLPRFGDLPKDELLERMKRTFMDDIMQIQAMETV